jgi:hypothetical protein
VEHGDLLALQQGADTGVRDDLVNVADGGPGGGGLVTMHG